MTERSHPAQETEARGLFKKELYAWMDENVARSEAARDATAAAVASMRRDAEKEAANLEENDYDFKMENALNFRILNRFSRHRWRAALARRLLF